MKLDPRPMVFAWFAAVLACPAGIPAGYRGVPFHDSRYNGGPQKIPGRVMCAYYDLGGEGIAYHDTDPENHGSGHLNPLDGTYLNEFRKSEAVDTSYAKYRENIDKNPFNRVQPPDGLLYVGWTEPGEWFNLTVDVAETGIYVFDILYTSNRGATLALDLNFRPLVPEIQITSTFDPAETVLWRNWHHWNRSQAAEVVLPAGRNVLTVHIVDKGNVNLAYLDFRKKS
jgi:hypothetical protein